MSRRMQSYHIYIYIYLCIDNTFSWVYRLTSVIVEMVDVPKIRDVLILKDLIIVEIVCMDFLGINLLDVTTVLDHVQMGHSATTIQNVYDSLDSAIMFAG
jgi:hypothetical protein